MSQDYLPKILEPGLVFQDSTKTLKDFIGLFKDIHQELGNVVTNLDDLEDNHSLSRVYRMFTLLKPHQFYQLSVGLLRLSKASVALQRILLKDAPGCQASEVVIRDIDINVTALLGSQRDKLKKAEEAVESGDYTFQVRLANSFLDAMYPE